MFCAKIKHGSYESCLLSNWIFVEPALISVGKGNFNGSNDFLNSDGLLSGFCHLRWSFHLLPLGA